jgi:hypothetical protein
MKNLLSENMMRFGTKNLTETAQKELVVKSIMETIEQHGLSNVIRKKLSEQADPNLGLAQKIVGQIWTGMSGLGTDEKKVYDAVMMIKSPEIYKSVLNIVKTSPKIKAEWGRNFPTVGNWLSTDMAEYLRSNFGSLDKAGQQIVSTISAKLKDVSGNWKEGIDLNTFCTNSQ